MTPSSLERAHRGQRLGVEAEQPVRVVLEDEDAVAPGDLDDLRSPLEREGHAGRVVEVRHGVEELDALALGLEARDASGRAPPG